MNTRSFLLLLVGLLAFLVYVEWQKDYGRTAEPASQSATAPSDGQGVENGAGTTAPDAGEVPAIPDFDDESAGTSSEPATGQDLPALPGSKQQAQITSSRIVTIDTGVLGVDLDANGGSLVELRLKDYPEEVDRPDQPFVLLQQDLPQLFTASMGLISSGGREVPNHRSRWEFEHDSYTLQDGDDRLEVPLRWRGDDGLEVVATWVFRSEEHTSELQSRGHLVCRLLLEKKNEQRSLECIGAYGGGLRRRRAQRRQERSERGRYEGRDLVEWRTRWSSGEWM